MKSHYIENDRPLVVTSQQLIKRLIVSLLFKEKNIPLYMDIYVYDMITQL